MLLVFDFEEDLYVISAQRSGGTNINKKGPSFQWCDVEDATVSGEVGGREKENTWFGSSF